ncbi:MAG: ATP-binding cassette domain-containing protein, partial [Spirillospora sp.]
TLPLAIAGRSPDPEWFATVIDTVGLRDRLGHRPSELSGGQQQRVACARALVSRPEIVFADEPTGNLDSTASDEVMRLLRHSVDEFGQTVVMVTHDPVAASHTDRVVFLADGRVVDEMREPTGALDTRSARDVLSLLQESVQLSGQTVVMVTHDPVAASFAHAVLYLADGRIVGHQSAPTAEAVAERMTHLAEEVERQRTMAEA